VTVAGDAFGRRILSWTQADGRTVGVMTFGLTQADLSAVAESLLAADATIAPPHCRRASPPLGAAPRPALLR